MCELLRYSSEILKSSSLWWNLTLAEIQFTVSGTNLRRMGTDKIGWNRSALAHPGTMKKMHGPGGRLSKAFTAVVGNRCICLHH